MNWLVKESIFRMGNDPHPRFKGRITVVSSLRIHILFESLILY
ncbi:hypothetical protein [Thermosphaera sp.]